MIIEYRTRCFQQVVHKAGKFIGKKISDTVTKSNDEKRWVKYWEKGTCWRNNYSTRKKRWNIKQIEKSITKMEHYKISKLLNNSTLSKFATKKWVKVHDFPSGQYSVNKNIRFKGSMWRLDWL